MLLAYSSRRVHCFQGLKKNCTFKGSGIALCVRLEVARRGSSTFPFPYSRIEAPRLHRSIPLAKIYPNKPQEHSDPK